MVSDDELIHSIKEGNTQHFEHLIERYKIQVLNFINRMVLSYEDAQNLAQDVFLKVYQNLHRYRPGSSFQAFLYTIAKNLTLNHIKKNKRMVPLSHLPSQNPADRYFSSAAGQDEFIEEGSREKLLVDGLRSLKENYRLALILKIYLDFSYKKIADVTGWSIPKIETLISRAKTQLKNFIQLQETGEKNVSGVRE